MSNEAKVRIGGDATGASKAADATVKGIEKVAASGKKAGKDLAAASIDGAKAEKQYEAEVQKVINRLRQKEVTAKATAEAMNRLGMAESKAGGGGGSRSFLSRPPAGHEAGFEAERYERGIKRFGGPLGKLGGEAFGVLGVVSGPFAALAGIAGGLGVAFEALKVSSERTSEKLGEEAKAEQQRAELIKNALKELGATALGASSEGGSALRQAVARGVDIRDVQALAERTSTSNAQASQIAGYTQGLPEASVNAIEQAVRDAIRLGVDPVQTAAELRGVSASGSYLGGMKRDELLRSAGNLFNDFSDTDLLRGTSTANGGANVLQSLSSYATRDSRAGLSTLTNAAAINAADTSTAEEARRKADPINAAMTDLAKTMKDEVKVLEAMAKGEHPLIKGLTDLTAAIRGGQGSYGAQASAARERLAGFR
jgi:hypothetical protein